VNGSKEWKEGRKERRKEGRKWQGGSGRKEAIEGTQESKGSKEPNRMKEDAEGR
jgi:hypothetical protein